jgi:hypothetical protein
MTIFDEARFPLDEIRWLFDEVRAILTALLSGIGAFRYGAVFLRC